MAWNLATWATFPLVLLLKNLKFSKFHQELTQELKTKPGTNPGNNSGTKNLCQQLNLVPQELSYEHWQEITVLISGDQTSTSSEKPYKN